MTAYQKWLDAYDIMIEEMTPSELACSKDAWNAALEAAKENSRWWETTPAWPANIRDLLEQVQEES